MIIRSGLILEFLLCASWGGLGSSVGIGLALRIVELIIVIHADPRLIIWLQVIRNAHINTACPINSMHHRPLFLLHICNYWLVVLGLSTLQDLVTSRVQKS